MRKRRIIALLLLVLATIALTGVALAEGGQTTITASEEHLYVAVGKSDSLRLTFATSAARKAGVTYAISDTTIATVNKSGKVTGVALGDCTLTITSKQDPLATLDVPVSVVTPVKKITATLQSDEVHVGGTTQVICAFAPDNATFPQAVYESANERVATVDENGVVTGVSRGKVNINIRSLDGYAKATVRVRVKQQPTEITLSPETLKIAVGKRGTLKATVLPKDADDKSLTWSSSDETIATVDSKGRITSLAPGSVIITATSVDDPSVSASMQVDEVLLAKSVSFDEKNYYVIINETTPTSVTVSPEETTDKSVTYKSRSDKIATIDENGVITGVKGGKTTVSVTTADGSKRSAKANVEVIVPVTGVTYKSSDLRVGAGSRGSFTANIIPEKATNRAMKWVSSDETIATVTGKNNKFSVKGRKWGRCTITGVTEDGGYSVTINVNVGSLRHAVVVRMVEIRNGKPYIVLQNRSNMNITNVRYQINGYDSSFAPVKMSTRGNTLNGTYPHALAPQEKTKHGSFSFNRPTKYPGMVTISLAVTGWDTDTGYYANDGTVKYSYNLSTKNYEWVTWSLPGDQAK